jgi:Family of unknown function (DUF6941)
VKATLLLADAAQAVEGKLYVLGGGWSVTGPQPTPMAIALKIDVPWDQTNTRHNWRLELLDADGEPVRLGEAEDAGEAGGAGEPVRIEQEFEMGRPPGVKPGTSLDHVVAINIPPLPLPPGGQFLWELTIDGESRDDWRLPFTTRPATTA